MSMSSIADLCDSLLGVSADISGHIGRLEREQEEISALMGRAQNAFGDTEAGQQAVLALSAALRSLSEAGSSLYLATSDISEYVLFIKK